MSPVLNTKDVKDYFYRHFFGLVKVNSVLTAMTPPRILSPKRGVEVRSQVISKKRGVEVHQDQMQAKIRVSVSDLLTPRKIRCSSFGFRSVAQMINVNESKIKRYAAGEVTLRAFSKLEAKIRPGMKQITVLPQERANRLQWQTLRPKKDGEVILAWFGPIVEDAVVRLTLNKRRGTLLIWYNPQSRRFDAKGLYLCRRMGLKENLEWRWVQ